jgi:hypothetical protein
MQALDNVHILPDHRTQWARLVLAVLEFPFLVGSQRLAQRRSDGLPELSRCPEGKKLQAIT